MKHRMQIKRTLKNFMMRAKALKNEQENQLLINER